MGYWTGDILHIVADGLNRFREDSEEETIEGSTYMDGITPVSWGSLKTLCEQDRGAILERPRPDDGRDVPPGTSRRSNRGRRRFGCCGRPNRQPIRTRQRTRRGEKGMETRNV